MIVEFKKVGGSYVDISDFVIEASEMPLYERNRDWSPIISDFNLSISQLFSQMPDLNDVIRVTLSAGYVYAFIVTGRELDYSIRAWKVTCKLNLSLLQSKILCRDNLHTKLVATGGDKEKYCLNDNWGYNNFRLTWVLQNMFTDAGLTLDVTDANNAVMGYFPRDGEPFNPQPLVQNNVIYGIDIKVDEIMLYMSGVSAAGQDWQTDPTSGAYIYDTTQRISYWTFITNILGICAWQIINTGENSYKLVSYQTQYSCNDDAKYQYKKPRKYRQYQRVAYAIPASLRSQYYLTGMRALQAQYGFTQSPTPDYTLSFPANMIFLFRDKWNATPGTVRAAYMLPWADGATPSYFYKDYMRDGYRKDFDTEEITTDLTPGNYECVSHFIDLGNRLSIIKQETKL